MGANNRFPPNYPTGLVSAQQSALAAGASIADVPLGNGVQDTLHEGTVFAHVVGQEVERGLAVDSAVSFEDLWLEGDLAFRGVQLRSIEEAQRTAHVRLHDRSADRAHRPVLR